MSDDVTCTSRLMTRYQGLVKCEDASAHLVHRGEGFTWKTADAYVEPKPVTATEPPTPTATKEQVGGDHYKGKSMQVFDIWDAFDLDPYEANAVKYILRHKKKNGREDVEKAIHYLQVILEKQYG